MRRETSWLRDSACCWPAVLMLVTMAVLCGAEPALAEKTVNAANLVCSSSGQETHSGLFAELNSNILKPDGWRVANPYPNVSGYSWRTDLAKLTDAQLAAFQVLRFSATSPVILSPGDSDRLRAWVSAGGTLWIDDAGGMLVANFFEPFDFRGYDGQAADGNKRAASWQHDLFTSVFQLTAEELSRLGHAAYSGHVAGFDQQAWVVAAVNGSDALPDILVRRLGQGRVVVTADNVGGAVADNRNPEDVKFCYNLLNWLNDQTPPNTQVTNGPGAGSTLCTAGATISWTGSDDTTAAGHLLFSWRLDGGAWSAWDNANTTTLSGLAQGVHTIEVAARDLSGNVDPTPETRTFIILTSSPVITDVSATPDATGVTVTWTSEPAATSQVEYGPTESYGSTTALDDSLRTSHSVALAGLQPLTRYYYRVLSTNYCGQSAVSEARSFKTLADTTPPETFITNAPAAGEKRCAAQQPFTLRASDNSSQPADFEFSWRVDQGEWSAWSKTASATVTLTDGSHSFEARARDGAGNVDSTPAACTVVIDLTDPQVTNAIPVPAATKCSIAWSTDEPSVCQLEYGPDETLGQRLPVETAFAQSHSATVSGLLPATTYYYRISARDACGHTNDSTVASFITEPDLSPPQTSISAGPAEGACVSAFPIVFKFNATDDNATAEQIRFSYRVDSGPWSEYSSSDSAVLNSLPDGGHTFQVKASDTFYNEDPSPAVRGFSVDRVPPMLMVPASQPAPGSTTAVITWTTNEPSTSEVEFGPTSSYGTTTPADAKLVTSHSVQLGALRPRTTYYYRVWSTDACGNTGVSGMKTITTAADTTRPNTQIISDEPKQGGKSCLTTVHLCWTGTDNSTPTDRLFYSYKLDSQPWSAYSSDTCHDFEALAEEAHTVQVRARDEEGNYDTSPAIRNFWVDTITPTIANVQATPGLETAVITWSASEGTRGEVEYGLTDAYGSRVKRDDVIRSAHQIQLTGLQPATDYHFSVNCSDGCREAADSDHMFRTLDPPNLQVTDIVAPPTAGNGETVNVSWTVRNTGLGRAAGNWVDTVWFSTDDACGNDTYIGQMEHSGGLDAQTSYSTTASVQLPTRIPAGHFWIIIETDSQRFLKEFSGESDNCTPDDAFIDVHLLPQPDMVVPAPPAGPQSALTGLPVSFTFDVKNLGAPTSPNSYWFDALYFSSDTILDPQDRRLGIEVKTGEVARDGAYPVEVSGELPEAEPGTYHILAAADSTDNLYESNEDNNTNAVPITLTLGNPDLDVTAFTGPVSASLKQKVQVSWTVENTGNGWAQGPWVDRVYFSTDSTLDAGDTAIASFTRDGRLSIGRSYTQTKEIVLPGLLTAEAGGSLFVEVDADNALNDPARANNMAASALQTVRLVSMVMTPGNPAIQLQAGETITGQLDLTNIGDVDANQIRAEVVGVAANIEATAIAPQALVKYTAGKVSYAITAFDESVLSSAFDLKVTSSEGATVTSQFSIRVLPKRPKLVPSVTKLETGMVRGEKTIVEFSVTNEGAGVARGLDVRLPGAKWMTLSTPNKLGDVAPGEKASVILTLEPDPQATLGYYDGTIVLAALNGWVTVPFRFRAVSLYTGSLTVKAQDEFTYFADDHPPVGDATVVLKSIIDGVIISPTLASRRLKKAEPKVIELKGLTNQDGTFTFNNVPEGPYNLVVTAEGHGNYDSPVEVEAGKAAQVNAFLPRNLVTYTWKVEPTEIEDRYDIKLEATYAVHVPAPVVTVEPMNLDLTKLNYDATGKAVVDYRVTNHGWIAADGGQFWFATDNPDYSMTPLVNDIGRIDAKSSKVIPVVVVRKAGPLATTPAGVTLAADSGPAQCCLEWNFKWYYICGIPIWRSTGNCIRTADCPSAPVGSGGSGGGGGGGGGGGPAGPVYHEPNKVSKGQACCIDAKGKVTLSSDLLKTLLKEGAKVVLKPTPFECEPDLSFSATVAGELCCLKDGSQGIGGSVDVKLKAELSCQYGPNLNPKFPIPTRYGTVDAEATFQAGLKLTGGIEGSASLSKDCGGPAGCLAAGVRGYLEASAGLQEASFKATGTDPFSGESVAIEGKMVGQVRTNLELGARYDCKAEKWNLTGCFQGVWAEFEITLEVRACADPGCEVIEVLSYRRCYVLVDSYGDCENPCRDELEQLGMQALLPLPEYPSEVRQADVQAVFDDALKEYQSGDAEAGVCARVKIEIDQRLTLTRNAFKATLEVNNDVQNVPLENVAVTLDIKDRYGEPAASLFQVRDPELTNVGDVSGTGRIVPGTTAKAVWIIVPTRDAAPTADSVEYSIGGTLRYLQGEQQLTIPLYPAAITVKPDPSLVLDYFLPQRVYSDDPWTENTERVEAFPLGLLITNKGYGEAKNVRIVSSQPKIVENLKGLLIDFKILNTQVNNGEIKPSLAVDLGTISPLQSSVARWFMTASLEGRFEEFSATFNHIDSLGNPRTSLIDHVDAHQLTHCVRITNPDDNKPDFLGNPVFDPGQHSPWLEPLPTKVWSSDGSISDVLVASNAVAPKVSTGGLVVELNATVQPGYCYIRVEDPGLERFRLVSIKRSDGAQILLGENAWTTHRTIRLVDRTYREHNLHVFDYNSTGNYTLTYADGRLSTEVDAGEGKGLGDGSVIRLAGVQAPVVTARFPGVFYAEQADRSSGIRIEWPGQVDPGTQIDVTGELHTNQDFERYIKAFIVSPIGSGVVDPLHIVGRSIGGPDLGYDPATGQGQRGTWAYQRVFRMPDGVWVRELRPVPGLSTIGLLISTEGRVTYAEGDHFVVDDGSNMDDGDPNRPGLRVVLPPGYLPPPMGSYVRVTGISSCYALNGLTYRLIRVWQAGDVQMIAATQ